MLADHAPQERARISSAPEARALVDGLLATLGSLAHIIGEETQLMREGRIGAALERETKKTELSGKYMRGLEVLKSNAVALARFVPDDVTRLKTAHLEFSELLETNQAVLATARAVSETVIRSLAKDAGRTAQPQGYGKSSYGGVSEAAARPSTGPIVLSKSL
ncbi:MAG: hypothetical protein NTZ14_10635 [Hyphomicrobiales bacterium]|jgi:hypothetical protein|nr:hypothetical protein [Hyphomicrobiales bacterium]